MHGYVWSCALLWKTGIEIGVAKNVRFVVSDCRSLTPTHHQVLFTTSCPSFLPFINFLLHPCRYSFSEQPCVQWPQPSQARWQLDYRAYEHRFVIIINLYKAQRVQSSLRTALVLWSSRLYPSRKRSRLSMERSSKGDVSREQVPLR